MKNYVVLILTLWINFPTYGQNLSGKFQRIDMDPVMEKSTTITFNKNSYFQEVTTRHLKTITIRNGDFEIKGDTLILNFHDQNQNELVVTRKDKISQNDGLNRIQTNLFLNVHSADEKKNPDAILHFKDENGKILIATTLKSENVFSLFDGAIKSLKISSLGKNDLEVNLENLLGYRATMDIYLSTVKYENAFPKSQIFIMERLNNGSLKLSSLNKEGVWILKKI